MHSLIFFVKSTVVTSVFATRIVSDGAAAMLVQVQDRRQTRQTLRSIVAIYIFIFIFICTTSTNANTNTNTNS